MTNEQEADPATEHACKRKRRRQRAGEKRLMTTFGPHLRKRLHEMAAEEGIPDSKLVFNLVREALFARKQRATSSWSKHRRTGIE